MKHLDYINSFSRFGSEGGYKPGLKRMNALLKAFDNPQEKLDVIHTAGSNGKGSTIAFMESIYQEEGYKVGVYSSPHLHRVHERIRVNGSDIKDDELEKIIEEIRPVVAEVSSTKAGRPSYFEILTLIAFIYFCRCRVDIVLLETGLGGRLDATNTVRSPLITIITAISLEHSHILGSTLKEIAAEKAGIIKRGVPVVTAVRSEEALDVIKERARSLNSKVLNIHELYDYKIKSMRMEGQTFLVGDKEYQTTLKGIHQVENALTALTAVKELKDYFPVKGGSIQAGFKKAFIPARIEIIQKNPLIICDGAHNPGGINSLVEFIRIVRGKEKESVKKYKNLYIIFSCLQNKDYKRMLDIFRDSFGKGLTLVLSKNKSSRVLPPEELYNYLTHHKVPFTYNIQNSTAEALKFVLENADKNDFICITGSLFTAVEAVDILKNAGNKV